MRARHEDSYPADPFVFGEYRIDGTLLLKGSRDVLLLLRKGPERILSDYKTTVNELRKKNGKETACSKLLQGAKDLDLGVYKELYAGAERIIDQIINKSASSI